MGSGKAINLRAPRKSLKTIYKESSVLGQGGVDFGEIVLIVGETDVGKSVFASDLAFDLAAGRNIFGGVKLSNPMKTYLVLMESTKADFTKIENGAQELAGYDKAQLTRISHNLLLETTPIDWTSDFLKELSRCVADGFKAIIVDNLNFIPINKTSTTATVNFIQQIHKILDKKAVLYIVAHTPKVNSATHASKALKGVSEWGDMSRTTLNIRQSKYYQNVVLAEWTKKLSALGIGERQIFLAKSGDDTKRYFVEIAFKDSVSKYANRGFEFIPHTTKEEIIKYIEKLRNKDKLLEVLSANEIFDSITHTGKYRYLLPISEKNLDETTQIDLYKFDDQNAFIPTDKSHFLLAGTKLWVGIKYGIPEKFAAQVNRPKLITPLNPNWEKYVGELTKEGKRKVEKQLKGCKKRIIC